MSMFPARKILLVANTGWNLWNYRYSLIKALKHAGYQITLAAPADRFLVQLSGEANADVQPLYYLHRKSLSPANNLLSLIEFYRLFAREQPDLVLLFTIKPNILGNIAARIAGVKTISMVEGLGHSGTHVARWRLLMAPLYRLAMRSAFKVIFLNADDRNEFIQQQLVRARQAFLLPGPGVDTEHFKPRSTEKEASVNFLFSGRLLSEKGIGEFVKAAQRLKQENAACRFYVLGAPDSGNPSSVSQQELDAWIEQGSIQYLGAVDDVRPCLASADVLVLPSYYREGVPRSVLEAMSMGKMILTTDTPGCRDTVVDGKNGFLVPPQNVEALVQAMRKIIQLSAEERAFMGAFSREKAIKQFSDVRVLPLYLALISEALAP